MGTPRQASTGPPLHTAAERHLQSSQGALTIKDRMISSNPQPSPLSSLPHMYCTNNCCNHRADPHCNSLTKQTIVLVLPERTAPVPPHCQHVHHALAKPQILPRLNSDSRAQCGGHGYDLNAALPGPMFGVVVKMSAATRNACQRPYRCHSCLHTTCIEAAPSARSGHDARQGCAVRAALVPRRR